MAKKTHFTKRATISGFNAIVKPSPKFAKDYSCSIYFKDKEAEQALKDLIDEEYDEHFATEKAKDKTVVKGLKPYQREVTVELEGGDEATVKQSNTIDVDGEERLLFKLKKASVFKNKETGAVREMSLPLYDSRRNEIKKRDGLMLFEGSEIIISFYLGKYCVKGSAGLSLKMQAVQILKAVISGSVDTSGFEASEEEDGFQYSDDEVIEPTANPAGGADAVEAEDEF